MGHVVSLVKPVGCYFNEARVQAFIDQQPDSTRHDATCPSCGLPASSQTRAVSAVDRVEDGWSRRCLHTPPSLESAMGTPPGSRRSESPVRACRPPGKREFSFHETQAYPP